MTNSPLSAQVALVDGYFETWFLLSAWSRSPWLMLGHLKVFQWLSKPLSNWKGL